MKIFNVYVNTELFNSFKRFVWRLDDDYFLRLGGVQLKVNKEGKLGINPVYYPLFSYKHKVGQRELTFYFHDVSYTLVYDHGLYVFKSVDKELHEDE